MAISYSSNFYFLQHIASRSYRQIDQVLQERLGIGIAQLKLLNQLEGKVGVSQRYLADQLGQTEAAISRQVKLLHAKGFILINSHPKSKRERIVALAPKGVKLTQAANEIVETHQKAAYDQMSPKHHVQLQEALDHLHSYYCESGKLYGCPAPALHSGYAAQDMI